MAGYQSPKRNRFLDGNRYVKDSSGAVYRIHANAQGVLNVLPTSLMFIPWAISWLAHWIFYPHEWSLVVESYSKPLPDWIAKKWLGLTFRSFNEAMDALEGLELDITMYRPGAA